MTPACQAIGEARKERADDSLEKDKAARHGGPVEVPSGLMIQLCRLVRSSRSTPRQRIRYPRSSQCVGLMRNIVKTFIASARSSFRNRPRLAVARLGENMP
jgi:hypothetical protein